MQLWKERLKKQKSQACTGFEPYDLCDTGGSALPTELTHEANWELVIWSVLNKPVKGKDERMNIIWTLYIWTAEIWIR